MSTKPMYTYDDFERMVQEYGFTPDQISDADRQLARNNADAGVALLGYKNDWLNADNDSAKAMAHAAAEDIRARYGNYTGGANGGSFTPTGTAEYEDPWETAVQAQIRSLENRKFSWSPETDPTLKYYEDAYRREGERAMKDTLGAVAATTGGIPSSYATAAAAQQRNYYAQQLTDKYPELYQQAYENFLAEYDRDYQMLDAYSKLSDTEYGRWFDQQERDRQARQDSAAAVQQAFENQYMLDELGLKERAQEHTESIDWAQIGLQTDELTKTFDLEYAKLDQNDRQHMDRLIYDYKVFDASNEQFWAELAQDKEISDANIKLAYDQLSEEAQQFLKTHALAVQKHEDDVRLTEEDLQIRRDEIKLEYDKLDAEIKERIKDRAIDYQAMLNQNDYWDALIKAENRQIDLDRDTLNRNVTLDQIELAFAAAEMGDFTLLKEDLGLNVDAYEALWNMEIEEQMKPTEEEVVDEIAGQTGNGTTGNAVTGGEVFNTPKEQSPVFIESPGSAPMMVTGAVVDNRHETANAGKSDTEIATENTQLKNEIEEQGTPEALYRRYLEGGNLTASEMQVLEKKYGKTEILKQRYLHGGSLTAAERDLLEKTYGKGLFLTK